MCASRGEQDFARFIGVCDCPQSNIPSASFLYSLTISLFYFFLKGLIMLYIQVRPAGTSAYMRRTYQSPHATPTAPSPVSRVFAPASRRVPENQNQCVEPICYNSFAFKSPSDFSAYINQRHPGLVSCHCSFMVFVIYCSYDVKSVLQPNNIINVAGENLFC